MSFDQQRTLGRTGVKVGRLGIASSHGAPAVAFEEAFERGCNYFTWGTFIKGRSSQMRQAIRNIIRGGRRDQLVIALYSYSHSPRLMQHFLGRGLRDLGTDYVDVLILGYHPSAPAPRYLERAQRLREAGQLRWIGLSGHQRKLFPLLARTGDYDLFHVRYNAAHRGAETEVFPALHQLDDAARPGTVVFTSTRWGRLLDPRRMPPGERPLSAVDCYRFVLSHPAVDLCLSGTRNLQQMRENLQALELGPMDDEELARARRIGDHVYGRRR